MKRQDTLKTLFEAQAQKTPGQTAVVYKTTKLSYQELDESSNRLAHFLQAQGVKKGDFVAFVLDRSADLIVVILAIVKTGAVYVPIAPDLPTERIEFIAQDAKAKLLITTAAMAQRLPKLECEFLHLDTRGLEIKQAPATSLKVSVTAEDLCYIIYTSGSTGTPKGVMVPHRGVVRLAKHMGYVDFTELQTFLLQTPISFDVSAYEIWSALLNGATLAIANPEKPTPSSVIQAMQKYGVTVLSLTTGLFHLLVEEQLDDLRSLRYIIAGGDVMLPHLTEKAARALQNTTIINGYGPTENSVYTTAYAVKPNEKFKGGVPIGKAIKKTTTRIVDSQLKPVEKGQVGELVTGGLGVAKGYWQRPELTADRFVPDPQQPNETLYRTGDLVRELPNGNIEFLGRIDQQVKIRGFRIELGEIENAILKYSPVKFCAVTVQEAVPGDKRIVAHIVLRTKNAAFDLTAFKQFLAQKMPEYMLPAHFVIVDSLPLNNSGKVDKKALPQTSFKRPDLGIAYEPPRSEKEKAIAALWRQLLLVDEIGMNDNFFDLGGNSMLAARATVQLQKLLETDLSAGALYEHPTIAQLCRLSNRPESAAATLDLAAEVQLAENIQPEQPFRPETYHQRAVLLTGATGFLGAFLIRELLHSSPDIQLYCLVRSSNKQEALKRIKHNLEKYSLWKDSYASRLIPLAGSFDKPLLGLSRAAYNHLAKTVDTIYHNGAKVNYVQSYELHKAANVIGTQNIIAFACAAQTKPIHFLSTIVSFGPIGYLGHVQKIMEEDSLDRSEYVLYKDMGYAQSKWVAEKILLLARQRGVPSTILRPGFIMGESTTGINNPDDFVARLVKGCIQLGAYPYLPRQRKEFTPVDFVAKAIGTICKSPDNFNKSYHLVPPHQESVDLNDFFVAIKNTFGYRLEQRPFAEWVQQLAELSDSSNPLTPFLPMLTGKTYKDRTVWELYENMPIYDSTNTQHALRNAAIVCPQFDLHLLKTYFNYMIETGFIPEPSKQTLEDGLSMEEEFELQPAVA
ncbi:MAG TPA: amino acid adenylation domain-containing protein [Verrucomicrobiae bacterium]|nr:amino acid adenylation domain-containing protein [Verrucomicrobiae bacterium]